MVEVAVRQHDGERSRRVDVVLFEPRSDRAVGLEVDGEDLGEHAERFGARRQIWVEADVEDDVAVGVSDEPRRDRECDLVLPGTVRERARLRPHPAAVEPGDRGGVHRAPRAGPSRKCGHGSGIGPASTWMSVGCPDVNASSSRARNESGSVACNPRAPKLSRVGDEVRVAEGRRDRPVVAELLLLHALDVAIGAVVEHCADERDLVLDRSRQLVAGEQEATVTGDDERLAVATRLERSLGAEAMGVAGAEGAGRAGRQQRAWPSEVEREVRGEADLRHVLDQHAVVRQHVADRCEVVELRPEMIDPCDVFRPETGDLVRSARAATGRFERVDQGTAPPSTR